VTTTMAASTRTTGIGVRRVAGHIGAEISGIDLGKDLVSRLRRKLDDSGEPLIQTVRGVGYVVRQVAE
jgi:hypothetical protein